MRPKPVIVVIGAASITFTPKLLRDMVNFPELGGSTMRFVDIDAERLDVMTRFAQKVNETLPLPWTLESTTDRRKALPGADYVVISVDVARNETWGQDWEIPARLSVRQVTGELGGPGGLFHSLRQIPLHLAIAGDIMDLCPKAVVMVESNPLNRICLAMHRYAPCPGIGQILGLCHGVEIAQWQIGRVLGMEADDMVATAAGTNHFTWILDLRAKEGGDDLYPALREKLKSHDPKWWPLSRKMFDVYGVFPSCGDEHIGEYLPFAWEWVGMEGPGTGGREEGAQELWRYLREQADSSEPMQRFDKSKGGGYEEERTRWFFEPRTWMDTLVTPIISAGYTNIPRRMPAVNRMNNGAIENLPDDVFVETPAVADASGCRLISIGSLPQPLAAFCRRDIDQTEITVEAAVTGNRNLILQAMLLDPVIDSIRTAEKVLDEMLRANAKYLPQFA